MGRPPPGRSAHLRSAIAEEAARLMQEHGIKDYLVAKRKAAERYGVSEASALPKNTEIESALFARQRLFGGEMHAASLQSQRRAAVAAMRWLRDFQPRLVGPVLNGSATDHADVQLHVFAERAESITLGLLERGIDYEVLERRVKMNADRILALPALRFTMQEQMVEAVVFPPEGIRQAPASPVDGRPMRRADVEEVEALLET